MNREQRVLTFESEIRMAETEGKRTIHSTAPPYGVLSVPMRMPDGSVFREQFAPGVFGDDLRSRDIVSTFNHDDTLLLGRTPGTLRLADKPDGLRYEVDLGDTTIARDVAEHVRRGDVRGSSFEFRVLHSDDNPGDSWEENEDGTWTRTVKRAQLFQVGPVTHPAYEVGTDVALRSLKAFEESQQTTAVEEPEPEPEALEPEAGADEAAVDDAPLATPRLDRARRRLRLEEVA